MTPPAAVACVPGSRALRSRALSVCCIASVRTHHWFCSVMRACGYLDINVATRRFGIRAILVRRVGERLSLLLLHVRNINRNRRGKSIPPLRIRSLCDLNRHDARRHIITRFPCDREERTLKAAAPRRSKELLRVGSVADSVQLGATQLNIQNAVVADSVSFT